MTEPQALAELKDCPFCGVELFIRTGVNAYGRCETAGCWTHERKATVPLWDLDQVEAWNTRPEPSGEPGGEVILAARALVDGATRTYTARNGRQCSIEADDGEACDIVHSDLTHALRHALDGQSPDCPVCSGDCAGANPPVAYCPMRDRLTTQASPKALTTPVVDEQYQHLMMPGYFNDRTQGAKALTEVERVPEPSSDLLDRLWSLAHCEHAAQMWVGPEDAKRIVGMRDALEKIASGEAAPGWRGIESAPKVHGHMILATNRHGVVSTICWSDHAGASGEGGWDDGFYGDDDRYTDWTPGGWQPLPVPPSSLPQAEPAGDLVERVARALWCVNGRASIWDGEEGPQWFAYMEERREKYLAMARAALSAIPTAGGEVGRVVAWLRSDTVRYHHPLTDEAILWLADAIERGDHRSTDEVGK